MLMVESGKRMVFLTSEKFNDFNVVNFYFGKPMV